MSLAAPSIWTPWGKPWWRLPRLGLDDLVRMTAGKLQRNPANGKLKRNPATGKLRRNTGTTTTCCCDCTCTTPALCDSCLPTSITVTFSGVTARGCVNCPLGIGGSRLWSGTLSGSYTVPLLTNDNKSDPSSCRTIIGLATQTCIWCKNFSGSPITYQQYGDGGCYGTPTTYASWLLQVSIVAGVSSLDLNAIVIGCANADPTTCLPQSGPVTSDGIAFRGTAAKPSCFDPVTFTNTCTSAGSGGGFTDTCTRGSCAGSAAITYSGCCTAV